jgi:SAM-dependent methyltransferase
MGCQEEFPIVRGTPILINNANSVFAIEDYLDVSSYEGASYGTDADRYSGLRARYRRFVHWLSQVGIKSAHLDAETALESYCSKFSDKPPRVLVIGSGTLRYPDTADFVYTDVAFSAGLDSINDAHDLPFFDCEFDLVLAVAVLEHVADPQRVVSEIWRTLKPGGRVYAVTPFLQPVHMGAHDFTRFTYLGHRRLFRWFSEIDSGLALGPGAAAAWSVRALLASFSDARIYRAGANLVGLLVGIPLKFLDYLTRRNIGALDGAAGVYFYGAKQERPISDRDMISLYRGRG